MVANKIVLFSWLVALVWIWDTRAQPSPEPLGPNIVDTGSNHYRFVVAQFSSSDHQRRYKVWTAIPKRAPPSDGYPVLYLLDGNRVMAALTEELLANVSESTSPPVLVAVGYQTVDPKARTFDYTPADGPSTIGAEDPWEPSRPSGGSAQFRKWMLETLVPHVDSLVILTDDRRRSLWGHSYGGLFVLDTLFESSYFRFFYTASPSVAWTDQRILRLEERVPPGELVGKQLVIADGNGTSGHDDLSQAEDAAFFLLLGKILATRLKDKGLPVSYVLYPGLDHGAMFEASLFDTIVMVSRPFVVDDTRGATSSY